MPYVAKHYTSINGTLYVEGEKIPNNLPEEKIKWLLSAGAIEEITPIFAGYVEETEEDASGEEVPDEETPEEEVSEEEVPEIDVMDGIVKNPTKSLRKTSSKARTKEGR